MLENRSMARCILFHFNYQVVNRCATQVLHRVRESRIPVRFASFVLADPVSAVFQGNPRFEGSQRVYHVVRVRVHRNCLPYANIMILDANAFILEQDFHPWNDSGPILRERAGTKSNRDHGKTPS